MSSHRPKPHCDLPRSPVLRTPGKRPARRHRLRRASPLRKVRSCRKLSIPSSQDHSPASRKPPSATHQGFLLPVKDRLNGLCDPEVDLLASADVQTIEQVFEQYHGKVNLKLGHRPDLAAPAPHTPRGAASEHASPRQRLGDPGDEGFSELLARLR